MAITFNEPTAEVASSTNTTSYALASFTPTANRLLVLWAIATGTTAAGSVTNTGTTLTWAKATSVEWGGSAHTIYCFWAQVPASTSASVITFNCTGDAATGCILAIQQYDGHNTNYPIRQVKTNLATSATASLTFDSDLLTGNASSAASGLASNTITFGSITSYTASANTTYTTPGTRGGAWYQTGGITSGSISSTLSGSVQWGMAAVEIWAAGFGPGKKFDQFHMYG